MRRVYGRGYVPRASRALSLRRRGRGHAKSLCEESLIPLEDLTHKTVPRRRNVVFSCSPDDVIDASLLSENAEEYLPLEQQASQIVDEMERDNSLMEDSPLCELRRVETLREMPESLTLKRTIRRKLVHRVSCHAKRFPLPLYKRLKYRISMSFTKLKLALYNMMYSCELWYGSIKAVEGFYGSGVASYFRFFRWLFLMNCLVCIVSHCFIVIPQTLHIYFRPPFFKLKKNVMELDNDSFNSSEVSNNSSQVYEGTYSDELKNYHYDTDIQEANFTIGNIVTGEGYFTHTVLYYGFYSNKTWEAIPGLFYNLPAAYFFTALFCYIFIFLSISISMAKSYRKSFIETVSGLKSTYAHKVFCGWDFSIATYKSAELKSKCIYNDLRELLNEDKEEDQSCQVKCHVLGLRLSVFLMTGILLICTGGIMWFLLSANLGYDEDTHYQGSMMMSLIVTIIMILSPVFFSWIVKYEEYQNPRTALFITLFRTFLLSMVVIGVLLAFWVKRSKSNDQECWETLLGQEVYRLVLMDFLIAVIGTALAEFVRNRIYLTLWKDIGQPEFDVARNTLNLIYNETLFFVGFFFSPLLSLIIVIKMFITFYIKKFGALKNCQPLAYSWRAAQTQTVFLMLSFFSLLGVVIVYGYVLANVPASQCGPFQGYSSMYQMILEEIFLLKEDNTVFKVLMFIMKPGVIAGILLGMCVAVYYLRAQSHAQVHMVHILQEMLILEAKDKEFLLSNISRNTEGGWMYAARPAEGHGSEQETDTLHENLDEI